MKWAELVLDCVRVQEVKGRVEEHTERALTTADPVEREQLVRQLVGGATTLGQLQERVRRDLVDTFGEEEELVSHYVQEDLVIALERSWSADRRSTLVRDVLSRLACDQVLGRSVSQTLRGLGTPRELVTRGGLSSNTVGCPD